jgi:apolipoprotein N-acyltransferase
MAATRTGRILRTTGLLALSVALLTLSFAPTSQFYLAWIGLVPWLLVLADLKSQKAAFFWSWGAGTAFFIANMWWMANISWPGMLALMFFCGTFWGYVALIIRGAGFLSSPSPGTPGEGRGGGFARKSHQWRLLRGILGIATVWTAFEWVRGIIFTGLPWLFLGYSQTPIIAVCQIADITGSYGVTFWLMLLNATVAFAWLHRHNLRAKVLLAASVVIAVTSFVLLYGIFRINQTPGCTTPGPTLALVQSNYPQSNNGSKGAPIEDRLQYHVEQSLAAIRKTPGKIDLVVWSETMMEALNASARTEDSRFQDVYDILSQLAAKNHVALLTGGDYWADWKEETHDGETYPIPQDRRNTAYLFDNTGHMNDSVGYRYDKIHLVPWGEFIPGKDSMPWLYRLSVQLGPNYYTDYIMQPGDVYTVFHLKDDAHNWRFVTPICFEDIDARICAAMFRPGDDGQKRADFLVNLTNDGWFKANENAQHFQAAVFRSIENRAPMARCVNTGISGFIDSIGRCTNLLPARTEGATTGQVMVDSRLSFYTRFGDLFAFACVGASAAVAVWAWLRRTGKQKVKVEKTK